MSNLALDMRRPPDGPPFGAPVPSASLGQTLAELAGRHDLLGGVYVHLGHGFQAVREGASDAVWVIASPNFTKAEQLGRSLGQGRLAARAAESLTPFAWSLEDLSAAEDQRLLNLMRLWDVSVGVVAPVQHYALGPAFLNLFAREPVTLAAAEAATLMLAAAQFHAAATAARPRQAGRSAASRLNGREVAVLRYAALGLTEQETAAAMALSRRSIQYYLASAADKLGAPNKTAAVARVVSSGLVRVPDSHERLRP